MALDPRAAQLTLSNQGCCLIYSELLEPSLSLGFFYKSLDSRFCIFGDTYMDITVRLGF